MELHRRFRDRLYYYQQHVEVDFFVPDEGLAVQVALSLADEATFRRGTSALEKLNGYSPLKRMLVLTLDEEREIPLADGSRIEILPIWKYLINGINNTEPRNILNTRKEGKRGK